MLEKVKTILSNLREHWTTPPEGYFVPHKETIGMSIGKFGYHLSMTLFGRLALGGSNIIISQTLRVDPVHVTVMNAVAVVIGLWFTMVQSHWVDNSHRPEGRYRPFMKYFGIPTFITAAAILWFPFRLLPNGGEAISAGNWGTGYWIKVAVVLFLVLCRNFFSPIYSMGHENIIKVMSPNTQERVNLESISTFVWSNAYAWADVFYYMMSGRFTNRLADIRLYRYAYLPMSLLGVGISYTGYFTTKERVLQSRAHINQMSIRETFREVAKNKNFWVLCAAQWAGFLENNSEELLHWTYVYQRKLTEAQFTTADFIWRAGAAVVPMVAPLAAKRFGKRALLITCNLMNIFLLAFTYKTFHSIPALVAFRFFNMFFNTILGHISPGVDADVRDAQQYISGERIDGMFSLVGYAGAFIGMGTGFVTPMLWRRGGIYEGNGAVDFDGNKGMWFALRDENIFNRVARMMIATSVIGAVMNVIPLFFYDLTEPKQRGMSKALRLRAMLEDYSNGILKPETRAECEKIVMEAREGVGNSVSSAAVVENQYVLDELSKYDTPEMRRRLALAREIADGGYEGILRFDPARIKQAKDKKDKEEKIVLLEMRDAQKVMARLYPGADPMEPDIRVLDELYNTQTKNRREARALRLQIRAIEQERLLFYRSTKPCARAKQLLADRENAARIDEIFGQPAAVPAD